VFRGLGEVCRRAGSRQPIYVLKSGTWGLTTPPSQPPAPVMRTTFFDMKNL